MTWSPHVICYHPVSSTALSCPRSGLRLFRKSQEIQESDANEDAFSIWKQSSTRPNLDTPQNVETPTDNTLGSSQTTGENLVAEVFGFFLCRLCSLLRMLDLYRCCVGMWEAKPEDQEQTDAIFKVSDLDCTDWPDFQASHLSGRLMPSWHLLHDFVSCSWWTTSATLTCGTRLGSREDGEHTHCGSSGTVWRCSLVLDSSRALKFVLLPFPERTLWTDRWNMSLLQLH